MGGPVMFGDIRQLAVGPSFPQHPGLTERSTGEMAVETRARTARARQPRPRGGRRPGQADPSSAAQKGVFSLHTVGSLSVASLEDGRDMPGQHGCDDLVTGGREVVVVGNQEVRELVSARAQVRQHLDRRNA